VVVLSLLDEPIGKWLGKGRLLLAIGFMVTGRLLAVVSITWCYDRAGAMQQIFTTENSGPVYTPVFIWMRYVIPVALFSILMTTIVGTIAGE
jgi:hypothetical protein